MVGEDQVLQAFDLLVEALDGVEVAVDEVVEQAVEEKPTPFLARLSVASQRLTRASMSVVWSRWTATSARSGDERGDLGGG